MPTEDDLPKKPTPPVPAKTSVVPWVRRPNGRTSLWRQRYAQIEANRS